MTFGDVSLRGVDGKALAKKVLLVSLLGAGLALVLEPDHSAGLPMLAAFGLWSTHILFAAILFLAALWGFQHLPLRQPLPAAVAILSVPVVFAPVSLLLDYGFGNPDEELQSASDPIAVYVSEVAAVAPVAFAVALGVAFILYRTPQTHPDPIEEPEALPLRGLIGSVPLSLGDDIIRMHAQDHFVQIVTAEGSALLSERFGDCVARLEPLDGLQCHRSHWIRLTHARSVTRSGSAYVCTLSNGDEVPVSRRRYATLKKRMGAGVS